MKSLFRVNRSFLYRAWRYYRDGFAIYVSKPLSIVNFLTITFYLLVERVSWLQVLLPHFYIYSIVALITLIPTSILFGWWHMRKSKVFGTEAILVASSNPLMVHAQRVSMEQALKVAKALNVPVSKEWLDMYQFWKRLDEKMKWKP